MVTYVNENVTRVGWQNSRAEYKCRYHIEIKIAAAKPKQEGRSDHPERPPQRRVIACAVLVR
jgi:hypothetical protein